MKAYGLPGRRWFMTLAAACALAGVDVIANSVAGLYVGVTTAQAQETRPVRTPRATPAARPDTARSARPRTRIIVRPRRLPPDVRPPTNTAQVYPSPYAANFPGPGYKRFCRDWYEEQHRPSGTVIFPRMQCEWRRVAQ